MNSTYNEQELGKARKAIVIGNGPSTYEQAYCVLRATSSKGRAPTSTDCAPVTVAARSTRLSIRMEQGAALDICVANTKLVTPSHWNAESQEYGS